MIEKVSSHACAAFLLAAYEVCLFASLSWAQGNSTLVFHKTLGSYSIDAYQASDTVSGAFLTLNVTATSGATRSLVLDRRIHKIKNVFVYEQSRVVIIGEGSVAEMVTVASLDTLAEIDRFQSYETSISPDARFMAFEKFFPANYPGSPSLYLVYDVTVSPAANRMVNTGSDADAGWVLYPDQNRQQMTYDVSSSDDITSHLLRSPLTWIDNAHLAFIDYSARQTKAVLVTLGSGIASPLVFQQVLDVHSIVDEAALEPTITPASIIFADSIEAGAITSGSVELIIHLRTLREIKVTTVSVQF